MTGCKQSKVDEKEEKDYNDRVFQLMEEIIKEATDKFLRKPIDDAEIEVNAGELRKDKAETKEEKDKIDDVLVPRKHKVQVAKNHFANRIQKREEEKHAKPKGDKKSC